MFNMTIQQKVDMIKQVLLVSINRPKDENDRDYQLSILKTSIDLCKISKGVLSNIFVKTFMENFIKSADYQMKCPFLKGSYNMYNHHLNEKFLPFPQKTKFYIEMKCLGKQIIGKPFVPMFAWKAFCTVIKQ